MKHVANGRMRVSGSWRIPVAILQSLWQQHPLLLLLFTLAICARVLLKSATVKGHLGEYWLRLVARVRLNPGVYHPLHDVTLPTPQGSTQIDHLFVSVHGIFVVETKNMKGWIFGGERDASWTQQIYRHKTRFPNPLRQNFGHCQALAQGLNIPRQSLHSVICFVGDSHFKTPMPTAVTAGGGFVRHIKSFRDAVFSESEVTQLLQDIQRLRLAPGRRTRKEHIARLQARRGGDTSGTVFSAIPAAPLEAGQPCPRCGKRLVTRRRRRGPDQGQSFLGCSGYPACRWHQLELHG